MSAPSKKAKYLRDKFAGLQLRQVSYKSVPVSIPDSFLAPLPDPSSITVTKIDFAASVIPEYRGLYAIVLDNLLSQEECDQLLQLAEKSTGAHSPSRDVPDNGWQQALVNGGPQGEFLALDYRNSDRIIWDEKILAGRLWARVLQADGLREDLQVLNGDDDKYKSIVNEWGKKRVGGSWTATAQGINERLRFLKYGPGQYFKQHCDGAYSTPDGKQRSFYTIHLYLNDSAQVFSASRVSAEKGITNLLRGGATTFHSPSGDRRIDVDPKVGRVLIFQHTRLLHSGDEVTAGIKYTVRSDIMYEYVLNEDKEVDSDAGDGGLGKVGAA